MVNVLMNNGKEFWLISFSKLFISHYNILKYTVYSFPWNILNISKYWAPGIYYLQNNSFLPISGRCSHACNKCVSHPMQMFSGLRILYWKYAQKADYIKILNFTICHAVWNFSELISFAFIKMSTIKTNKLH